MNYALVLDNAPFLYATPVHRFLERAQGRVDSVFVFPGIKDATRRRKYSRAAARIYGVGYIARTLWRYLWAPFWSLRRVARHHGVPLHYFDSVNAVAFHEKLQSRGISVVLSLTAEIYKKESLRLPGVKVYNLHGSLLPGNKGLLPIFWAFMNDAPQGITIHEINEKIDEGALLFQERIEGAKDSSVPAVTDALLANAPGYLLRAMDHLDQSLPPAPLPDAVPASYGPIPTDDDLAAYARKRGARRAR